MMHHTRLEHRFIEQFPAHLQAGVLYISMEYATAAHRCCCGCGEEVVTPFTPTDWKITFDGESVSLWPSIGNWNFACRSHYFIQHGRVIESETWTVEQIEFNRHKDRATKASYYGPLELTEAVKPTPDTTTPPKTSKIYQSFIGRCLRAVRMFLRNLT